jgi:hypothetical protein
MKPAKNKLSWGCYAKLTAQAGAVAADQCFAGILAGILKERRRGAPSATAASCLAIHWSASSRVGKFVTVIGDMAGIETSISNAPSLRAITL